MKKFFLRFFLICFGISAFLVMPGCRSASSESEKEKITEQREQENEEYDGPDKAAELEFRKTVDPALGRVPTERLVEALLAAEESQATGAAFISGYGTWTERGPNSDVNGPFGNSRPNSDVTAGRVRAILVDAADATGKTVFVGSVAGGLWKTTDITTNPANWVLVNDFLVNMAIADICQDPTNSNIMYFATGESYYNGDAVRGAGVFKSTDHGNTWSQLSATTGSSYYYCTRIKCDASGNLYVATRSGLFRSVNGGTSFTTITPSGLSSAICDLELSSTGRLHVVGGIFTTQGYRFTDNPSTVTSATWTSPTTAFPSYLDRAEIGVSGNTLYACPVNDADDQVPTIYKSTDGGANWVATATQPTAGWASQQGWYALSVVINPADANQCIVGGLDNWKTTDGGATWTKISTWVGATGQYVHADQHKAVWYDNGNKLIFGSDGGIFYTSDGGTTIRDRNTGLRIKQFYSCAAHPSSLNYFLAGAQDNGSHAFSTAGLGSSTEVTGGDGAFVHIDQDQPQYQFTSYVFNQYRRSTNSGSTWTNVNLSSTLGEFINPTDYDDVNNIMYCSNSAGTYRRWTNPQSGSTNAQITIPEFNTRTVEAITVSPYTSNRVYFGTDQGRIVYVDNANSIASGSSGTLINTGLPSAFTSCIAVGSNDQNLMVTFSNYGVQQVWVSSNGGTSWTNIDGNLPDMPVRWCMFAPNSNTKAIIATEAGVWLTQSINGSSTTWIASPGFPTVRTDMLQYRAADQMVVAATHGRGLWTQNAFTLLPLNNFKLNGRWKGSNAELSWTYEDLADGSRFEVESSPDAIHFTKLGTVMKTTGSSYGYTNPSAGSLFYRIKVIESTGLVKYSNVVKLFRTGAGDALQITRLYPNPLTGGILTAEFSITEKGRAGYMISNASGQVLWKDEEELSLPGSHSTSRNINMLKAGAYVFTVTLNGKKASQSFIKK